MMNFKFVLIALLVLAACAVMVRLGFWQLDRLAQRRVFNAEISARLNQPPLTPADLFVTQDIAALNYRAVSVRGQYDFSYQVALSNKEWQGQPGVHLVTPLIMEGSDQAVLVDRGWIPFADADPSKWEKFSEPGAVQVRGQLRTTQTMPIASARAGVGQSWFRVDIAALQEQMPMRLLPVYIEQAPDLGWKSLPYRSPTILELTDGSHLGYAITWFSFAAILGVGSIIYARSGRRRVVAGKVGI